MLFEMTKLRPYSQVPHMVFSLVVLSEVNSNSDSLRFQANAVDPPMQKNK